MFRRTSLLKQLKSISMPFRPPFDPKRLAFDPYTYEKGRWLDKDAERRQSRTLQYDFDSLLSAAVDCSPGAKAVVGCEKKEGTHNRIFLISLDSGKTVVARLPTQSTGPAGLAMESEVATLLFLKARTTIPVPTVLAWNSDKKNPVGAEYLIVDYIRGISLAKVWDDMKASQHIACISSLSKSVTQLCRLEFPGFGSLYLNSKNPNGNAIPLDDTFCVGPRASHQAWEWRGVPATHGHQGPWRTRMSYHHDLFSQSRDYHAKSPKSGLITHETHPLMIDIAEQTIDLASSLSDFSAASRPTLFHPDFHARNILVDPTDHTIVTGIIDWQFSAIEPPSVFSCEWPDFAQDTIWPDYMEKLQTPDENRRADEHLCAKAWATILRFCPGYRDAALLHDDLQTFLAAPGIGFLFDPYQLRYGLERLRGSWKASGLPGESLYVFDEPEGSPLAVEMDELDGRDRLQRYLMAALGTCLGGWVPEDRWKEVLREYRRLYEGLVECCMEEDGDRERAIKEADRLWPWDQR